MGSGTLPDYRPLPLLKILWGAFALPWQRRREIARVAFMPLLAVMIGPAGPLAAWKISRGNGLKLILIVCVLPYLLQSATGRMFGDRLSLIQAATAAALFAVCVVIQVMAVSLAYLQLTSPAPPPTDPPA